MGRGDFQESAGNITADMRCCAMPNRVLQGRQISWILLQNTHGLAVFLPRAKAPVGGGATGPLLWVSMRQRQKKEEKRCLGAKCWFKRG